jgi:hypothetical protein
MTPPAKHRKQDMRTRQLTTDHRQPAGYNNQHPTSNNQHPASKGGPRTANGQRDDHRYALRRGLGFWELTFEGQQAIFKHELGALYVACLLLDPPSEPIHAVALALKAREMGGQAPGPSEVIQQRSMGLDDAATVRTLWCRQRALEAVLEDDRESEPVKAEALRELEEITEFLRKSP